MSKPGAYITNNTTQFTRLYSLGCVMLNTLKLLSSAPTDTDSSDITWDSLSDFIQLPLETQKALYYFFTHVVVLNTWKQMLMCEIGGVPLQDTVCGDQEVTTSPWFQHHIFSQEYENEFLRAIFWCDLPLRPKTYPNIPEAKALRYTKLISRHCVPWAALSWLQHVELLQAKAAWICCIGIVFLGFPIIHNSVDESLAVLPSWKLRCNFRGWECEYF